MGCLDINFSCPECFGNVMQVRDGDEIYYSCLLCGTGPLVFCEKCFGLITLESLIICECIFCETESLLRNGKEVVTSQKYYS